MHYNIFCPIDHKDEESDCYLRIYDFRLSFISLEHNLPNNFFLENALKKTTEYFLKLIFFIWKYIPSG